MDWIIVFLLGSGQYAWQPMPFEICKTVVGAVDGDRRPTIKALDGKTLEVLAATCTTRKMAIRIFGFKPEVGL